MYNTTLLQILLEVFSDERLMDMGKLTDANILSLKPYKDCNGLDTYPNGYLVGETLVQNKQRIAELSKKLSDSKRMKPKTYLGAPVLNKFGKQKMEATYTQPLEVRQRWETERTNLLWRHNLTVLFDLLKDACVRYGQQGDGGKPAYLHLEKIYNKYNDDGCGTSQSCVSRWNGVSHKDRVKAVIDEFYGVRPSKGGPRQADTPNKEKWSTSKKVFVFGGVALIGVGGFFVSKKYFN